MRVLDICTGAGLLSRAFLDEGFDVIPVCEIDEKMQAMYVALNGRPPLYSDLRDLRWAEMHFGLGGEADRIHGVIGGPPCQSHSKTRAMRAPKFPDLTPDVLRFLAINQPRWFLFENVAPLAILGAKKTRLDAMHFSQPHQSRVRWFTHSDNITPPPPIYSGTVDDLCAYPAVCARLYGPKRGAVIQGYPEFASLRQEDGTPFPCADLQLGLANSVPYPLARAWARSVKDSISRGNENERT